MRISKSDINDFDILVLGLGYESRSIFSLKENNWACQSFAYGYDVHTEVLLYPDNKVFFENRGVNVIEGDDEAVFLHMDSWVGKLTSPVDILLDISVFSRFRLANFILKLLVGMPSGSSLTVTYSVSEFISPPVDISPIKKITSISDLLSGALGDLGKPLSLIFGLGYEKDKAIGVAHYFDCESDLIYALVPLNLETRFESAVFHNNESLLKVIPSRNLFKYSVNDPISTYHDLKNLVLSLLEISRPLLIPLGPKILSAIGVIVGYELLPDLPVWRVSSNYSEPPVDRPACGDVVKFTVQV